MVVLLKKSSVESAEFFSGLFDEAMFEEQQLFEIEIVCNILKITIVTFDLLMSSS